MDVIVVYYMCCRSNDREAADYVMVDCLNAERGFEQMFALALLLKRPAVICRQGAIVPNK